ncbi:alpha/beta fold hydrolase [Bacillus sp. CGMCC 1.16607]|uniref:alpha/beta fold hydrolase n=1 Tax=Bacillus sp. CGMCC 1.16607 TaxID=3351842 RepID=UPI00364293CA
MEYQVSNGTINYETIGEGSSLLFLHSMGTDHRSMKAWAEPIFENMENIKRIYIDIPAHGYSKINHNLQSTKDILNNLLEFIDGLLLEESFSIIGHSFGGYLAQGIMHNRMDMVKGICLMASALHIKNRTLPEKVVIEKDESLLDGLDADIRLAFETLMIYQNKEKLELFLKEIQPGRLVANRDFLSSNWKEKGYFLSEKPFEQISNIVQPTLIIAGKQDSICGYKDYVTLLDLFSNSTVAFIDGAGHMIQMDKRELVQALVKDWLNKIYL